MIRPKCDHCGLELTTYGGLAFSPPVELSDGSADPNVKKKHICTECWKQFEEWLMCPLNSIEAMFKVCQGLLALDKYISLHESFQKDWEPLVGKAREAITYKGGGTVKP